MIETAAERMTGIDGVDSIVVQAKSDTTQSVQDIMNAMNDSAKSHITSGEMVFLRSLVIAVVNDETRSSAVLEIAKVN